MTHRLFLCMLILLLPSHLWAAEDPSQIKQSLLTVQTEIKKIEKNLYQAHSLERSHIQKLAAIEKLMGEQAEKLREQENKILEHQQELQALEKETNELNQVNQVHQKALSRLISVTFTHYHKEKLKLLLNPHEMSKLARLNQYYVHFYALRANKIRELQAHLGNVKILQAKIKQKQNAILALTDSLKIQQKELQVNKTERANLLEALTNERKSAEEKLISLQSQEQHLEQLFKAIQAKVSTTPTYIDPAQDFAKMKRRLALPIKTPGALLAKLPHAKKTKAKKSYIQAEAGTPVSAIFPGRVVFAEWLRGVGLLLIIDHGDGYMSLYGNNQKLYKSLGEWVSAGEMVARVGQSGGHAEPGLYFEIRKDGEALDPTPWFRTA
ncbi:MAG: murein hydrolase activator EnvC [Candidatus Berkiella sp.]